jgi:hypothetical protein
MDIVLSAVVMTHPRRMAAAQALRRRHPELDLGIIVDPDPDGPPDPLRTARLAWGSVRPGATHHLVVQDDMLLVDGIAKHLHSAIEAMPDGLLCLFSEWGSRTSHAVRLAAMAGAGWVPVLDPYVPTASHVLPATLARSLAEYPGQGPDDVMLWRFVREHGLTPLVCAPNLAQHEAVDSLMGNDLLMGPRRSAWWECPERPFDDRVLRAHQVPHLLMFEGVAICHVRQGDTWEPVRAHDFLLEQAGITLSRLLGEFASEMDEADPAGAIRDVIGEPLLLQLWLTALLYGYVAGAKPPEPAWRTFAPGALRRFVPVSRLDELSGLVTPLLDLAIRFGSSIGKNPSN